MNLLFVVVKGATALAITTLSITMLCSYADCRILSTVMLNAVVLSIVGPLYIFRNICDCRFKFLTF